MALKAGKWKMISGSLALLWLLAGSAAAPATDLSTELAAYSPASRFASLTLIVNSATNSVGILAQDNVEIKVLPAEYQDLKISKAFVVECVFPRSYRLKTVDARVDRRSHLIPIDIIEYKEFNPSYIKLGIDESYLTNGTDNVDPADHKVYISFFTDPR